jgi:TatD DNase family protein
MIDAHIHWDDSRFDSDREALIKTAQSVGISKFVSPAVGVFGFDKLLNISKQFDCIYPTYGLHPYFIKQHLEKDLEILEQWIQMHKPIAVGECGLDFFFKDLDPHVQAYFFEAQIALAKKYNLPLILHARNAVEAVYDALKNADYFNAMIHSYNGSIQQTKKLLNHGIKFSFGGAICNPKAHQLHKLIQYCPQDSVMFETDAPDQNLYPDFKLRNEPKNLLKVIEKYSEITGIDFDIVIGQSKKVSYDFFKI